MVGRIEPQLEWRRKIYTTIGSYTTQNHKNSPVPALRPHPPCYDKMSTTELLAHCISSNIPTSCNSVQTHTHPHLLTRPIPSCLMLPVTTPAESYQATSHNRHRLCPRRCTSVWSYCQLSLAPLYSHLLICYNRSLLYQWTFRIFNIKHTKMIPLHPPKRVLYKWTWLYPACPKLFLTLLTQTLPLACWQDTSCTTPNHVTPPPRPSSSTESGLKEKFWR